MDIQETMDLNNSAQTTNVSLEPRPATGSSLPLSLRSDTQPSGDEGPEVQWQVPYKPREIWPLQGPGEPATVSVQSRQGSCPHYTDEKLRPGQWQARVQGVKVQDENGPFSPFSCVKL